MKKVAPHTAFRKTKLLPIKVFLNNKEIESETWDTNIWIERGEDWYGLMSSDLKDKKVRIIERSVWLKCKEI